MKNWTLPLVLSSILFMTACDEIIVSGAEGIPDDTFRGIEPVYANGKTVGNLTESYIKNTESLVTVNGRLEVLCKAHEVTDCTPE